MSLTMAERRAVVKATARRYQRGRKKEKQKMLDEFVELTGYNRQAARQKRPAISAQRRAMSRRHYD